MKTTGRSIGIVRLTQLIRECESEFQERNGTVALRAIKRALGIRGDRSAVLDVAREIIADVANW